MDSILAFMVGSALRWTYRLTGWRPLDDTITALGARFKCLQDVPARMRDGRWLHLDLSNPVSVPYLLEGDFSCENAETELVKAIVQRGDTALDIGANLGWYASLLCHLVGEGGGVHAFEPNRQMVRLLKRLQERHRQLHVHPLALGARKRQADFHVPQNWVSGSLAEVEEGADVQRTRVVPLDDYLEDIHVEGVDFIKLDAEGAEPLVLEGARQTLECRDAPLWMVELSTEEARRFGHRPDEVAEFFAAAGPCYTPYLVDQQQHCLRPLALPDVEDFWLNALFVPEGRHERIPAEWLA